MMTIRDVLNRATVRLENAGIALPRLDVEVLLSAWLCTARLDLYKSPEKTLTEEEISAFARWIDRRVSGEPVAYITGEKEFWSLPFEVNSDVLVPRPETEILVEEALKICGMMSLPGINILEIGIGSGAVSVALATELPEAQFTATDISQEALSLARKNARVHGVEGHMNLLLGNLFEPVSGLFDVILSNPPYVSAGEFACLSREVREYEPQQALLAGAEGIAFHRQIIACAGQYLKKRGWLLMEMGDGQRASIEEALKLSGVYDTIEVRRDYGGIERVIKARKR